MLSRMTWRSAPVLVLLLLCVAACGGGASDDDALPDVTPPPGGGGGGGGGGPPPGGGGGGGSGGETLQGGVLVTLVQAGDLFHIWVTEPLAAQTLVDIWSGGVAFMNITGPIRTGPGEEQHNTPWSWHLDPTQILVNISTFAPVYSGTPSEVDANLAGLLAVNSDKMTSTGQGTLQDVQDLRGPALSPVEVPTVR